MPWYQHKVEAANEATEKMFIEIANKLTDGEKAILASMILSRPETAIKKLTEYRVYSYDEVGCC